MIKDKDVHNEICIKANTIKLIFMGCPYITKDFQATPVLSKCNLCGIQILHYNSKCVVWKGVDTDLDLLGFYP